jgi:hypothetical protein
MLFSEEVNKTNVRDSNADTGIQFVHEAQQGVLDVSSVGATTSVQF